MPEGWIPWIGRKYNEWTTPPPPPPSLIPDKPVSLSQIKQNAKDAGSKLLGAVEDPIGTVQNYGTDWWNKNKDSFIDTGNKVLGSLGAVTTAPVAKMGGAMMDVTDPRNTGSEAKPMTDVLWEGGKAAVKGLSDPLAKQPELAHELGKRAGPTFVQEMKDRDPIGFQVSKLGLNNVDTTNLGAVHGLAGIVGAGAHLAGMAGHANQEAMLPMDTLKWLHGIEGFSHGTNSEGDARRMLTGGVHKSGALDDVMGRWTSTGVFGKDEVAAAKAQSRLPTSKLAEEFAGGYANVEPPMQVDVQNPKELVMDLTRPMPREDLDTIISHLDPVEDAPLIATLERKWAKTAPHVIPDADLIKMHGEGKPSPLQSIDDPDYVYPPWRDDVNSFERTVVNDQATGRDELYGREGRGALNTPSTAPSMNAVLHHDTLEGQDLDALQMSLNPDAMKGRGVETPNEPWQNMRRSTGKVDPVTGEAIPATTPYDKVPKPIRDSFGDVVSDPVASSSMSPALKTFIYDVMEDPGATSKEVAKEFFNLSYEDREAYKTKFPLAHNEIVGSKHWKDLHGTGWKPSTPQSIKKQSLHAADLKDMLKDSGLDKQEVDNFIDSMPHTMSPHELHQEASAFASSYGKSETAKDIDELWELKKAVGEGSEYTAEHSGAANKFYNNVASQLTITPQSKAEKFHNLRPEAQQAFKDQYPAGYQALEPHINSKAASDFYYDVATNDATALPEKLAAWHALEPGVQEGYKAYFPSSYKKLETKLAEEQLKAKAKIQSVASPIAQPGVEGQIKALSAKYPEIAKHFASSAHVSEGSTIGEHTADVGREWAKQMTPEEMQGLSARSGVDLDKLMHSALALHDIGKNEAVMSGAGKGAQHSYTIPIMQDILRKEGFPENEVNIATELLNHDMIGPILSGEAKSAGQTAVVQKLKEKAAKVGMDPADFTKLQLAVYEADAGSYPFVQGFMKQTPTGKWTFSGNPKISEIEALASQSGGVSSPLPTTNMVAPPMTAQNFESAQSKLNAGVGSPIQTPVGMQEIPPEFKLKHEDAHWLNGVHHKMIYTKNGEDYIFKPVEEGYHASITDREHSATKIAELAGLHPVDMQIMTHEGTPGVMQKVIGNKLDWPTLRQKGKKLDTVLQGLSTSELKDIIKNHPVDWLTGNNDAHAGQWLKTPTGVHGIDKGQAFKHYAKDNLSKDYDPNYEGDLDSRAVYYQLHELWKTGKLPQLAESDIHDALRVSSNNLKNNAAKVQGHLDNALDAMGKGDLKDLSRKRFNSLWNDMLQFWAK